MRYTVQTTEGELLAGEFPINTSRNGLYIYAQFTKGILTLPAYRLNMLCNINLLEVKEFAYADLHVIADGKLYRLAESKRHCIFCVKPFGLVIKNQILPMERIHEIRV